MNNGNIAAEFGTCWLRPILYRERLSEGDGWACKGKCASNVDYYEVIGLGAIDQNDKSILNGNIMQHVAKGKDLGTIPKSHNLSLGPQLKKKKIKEDTGTHSEFRRIQFTRGRCCFTVYQLDPRWSSHRWSLFRRGPCPRSCPRRGAAAPGRDRAEEGTYPPYSQCHQHKHSQLRVCSYCR